MSTTLSRRELDNLNRLARQAAGIPENNVLDLIQTHLPTAVNALGQVLNQCSDHRIRMDAARMLIELGEGGRKEQEKRDEQYYAGSALVLEALALLPQADQRPAALQMFAKQQLNRTDLDSVLKVIDDAKDKRIADLIAENERLVRVVEGNDDPAKVISNDADKIAPEDEARPVAKYKPLNIKRLETVN